MNKGSTIMVVPSPNHFIQKTRFRSPGSAFSFFSYPFNFARFFGKKTPSFRINFPSKKISPPP